MDGLRNRRGRKTGAGIETIPRLFALGDGNRGGEIGLKGRWDPFPKKGGMGEGGGADYARCRRKLGPRPQLLVLTRCR